jgi:hypothetical protein
MEQGEQEQVIRASAPDRIIARISGKRVVLDSSTVGDDQASRALTSPV